MENFTFTGFLLRLAGALLLVLLTFNPSGYSYYHWVAEGFPAVSPLEAIAGLALLSGWIVFLTATARSIGLLGAALAIAFFAAFVWLGVAGSAQSDHDGVGKLGDLCFHPGHRHVVVACAAAALRAGRRGRSGPEVATGGTGYTAAMRTVKAFSALAGTMVGALALSGSIGQASAQGAQPAGPQLYTVEIVVFRTRQPLGVAEDWSTQGMLVQPSEDDSDGAASGAPMGTRAAVKPLTSAQFKLAGTDAALRRSANYQVLAHVAWTQAATPRNGNAGASLAELGVTDSALRGTVALEQGRYLHLNFDLAWTPVDPPSSLLAVSGNSKPVTFTLRQKRRVRAFEQHYFDHPAFGVIAIISPAN